MADWPPSGIASYFGSRTGAPRSAAPAQIQVDADVEDDVVCADEGVEGGAARGAFEITDFDDDGCLEGGADASEAEGGASAAGSSRWGPAYCGDEVHAHR